MQGTLFQTPFSNIAQNLLPIDGCAHYLPRAFSEESSTQLMDQLQKSLVWEPDQIMMFGKIVTMRRKVAWVANSNCPYTYSGIKKTPQPWTPELLLIKAQAEELAQAEFNSCLLNLYHDGQDGMGWHSDNEKELDRHSPIASLSFGAQRKFAFRHKKDKQTIGLTLENGSALIMYSPTQEYWQHALLKTQTVSDIRINLTFRKIIAGNE